MASPNSKDKTFVAGSPCEYNNIIIFSQRKTLIFTVHKELPYFVIASENLWTRITKCGSKQSCKLKIILERASAVP